jgi:hypothetical protein
LSKEKIIFWMNVSDQIEDYQNFDQIVTNFENMGVRAVILHTTFANLVTKLKSNGFMVYSEFSCFEGEEVWKEYSDCIPVDFGGERFNEENGYYGVNPANPKFRKDLFAKFKKLIQHMNIDGVWFNRIHWPCYWQAFEPVLIDSSFDENTLNLFLQDNQLAFSVNEVKQFIIGEGSKLWAQWKCSVITSWVKLAWEIRNQFAPDVKLGIFTVPWVNGEYNNALFRIIGQDYRMLTQYVDYFTPMLYYQSCKQPVTWINDVISKTKTLTDRNIVPIVHVEKNTNISDGEEPQQNVLELVLSHPDSAGCIIAY